MEREKVLVRRGVKDDEKKLRVLVVVDHAYRAANGACSICGRSRSEHARG